VCLGAIKDISGNIKRLDHTRVALEAVVELREEFAVRCIAWRVAYFEVPVRW